MDSRLRGNDRRGCLLVASLKLAATGVLQECAEGRSSFAGGLGVSPNSLFFSSPKIRRQRFESAQNDSWLDTGLGLTRHATGLLSSKKTRARAGFLGFAPLTKFEYLQRR